MVTKPQARTRRTLEQLKFDQSFVRDIFIEPNDLSIVRAIVTLGHSLVLAAIAEEVETQEEWSFLQDCGCAALQGYLFAKPIPVDTTHRLNLKLLLWHQAGPVESGALLCRGAPRQRGCRPAATPLFVSEYGIKPRPPSVRNAS